MCIRDSRHGDALEAQRRTWLALEDGGECSGGYGHRFDDAGGPGRQVRGRRLGYRATDPFPDSVSYTHLDVYKRQDRERVIFDNVRAANRGPLPDIELTHIYERIIDVMRALQKDELASSKTRETGKQS